MDEIAAIISDEIGTAFPPRMETPSMPLVRGAPQGQEPLDVASALAGRRRWADVPVSTLNGKADSALCFLPDETACFFLPAFLVADLAGQLRVDPLFHLTHGFDEVSRDKTINPRLYGNMTWWMRAIERWRHLSRPQTRAVVHYLEYRAWRCDLDRRAIVQSLAAYWYVRNAGVDEFGLVPPPRLERGTSRPTIYDNRK